MSDPSMISKWENLQNLRMIKYLLTSLYVINPCIKITMELSYRAKFFYMGQEYLYE